MTQLAELKTRHRRKMGDLPDQVGLAELAAKRDKLLARLNKGWELVKPGGSGENDNRLHDHFAELLQKYEMTCDQISSMAAGD
jgi:hypothetical protein